MIISASPPPNFDRIKEVLNPPENTVFTYGERLHCPDKRVIISDDLIVHETIHSMQQGKDPEAWWQLYLIDPEFRKSQEMDAYRNQYNFYCLKIKDRNMRAVFAKKLADDFSRYYDCLFFKEAFAGIRSVIK
mgnify:CR=1 FL=1